MTMLISCADYEEGIKVVNFDVKLEFPSTYNGSYEGLRVELQDAVASTFVDSTREYITTIIVGMFTDEIHTSWCEELFFGRSTENFLKLLF